METVIVLLSRTDTESHFDAICKSTKFDFGRGLAYFDRIHTLPGPPRKSIFLRQSQENRNSKSIGQVLILPARDKTILTFETESPNADFEEFALLVKRYFQDLNLLDEPEKPSEPAPTATMSPEPPIPISQVINMTTNIAVNGNVNGNIVVGDKNDLNITK